MKQLTRGVLIGLSLTTAALAGTAYAEQAVRGAHEHGRDRGAPTTRAEVQTRSAAMFARMDANKDGKLDQADREARRGQMFDRIDTDKNGQISRSEFTAKPQRPEGMAERGAGAKGPDGEGGRHHGWGRGGKGGRGHHGGMGGGRFADANKDGAVTQAEFTAAALQRFDATDANKDGTVTKEERQAHRQTMREQWKARKDAAKPAAPAT